jgi:hypothetical protein
MRAAYGHAAHTGALLRRQGLIWAVSRVLADLPHIQWSSVLVMPCIDRPKGTRVSGYIVRTSGEGHAPMYALGGKRS